MDWLTLPQLHPSIPHDVPSASAEALFMDELKGRVARGHVVRAHRARNAQQAAEATLRTLFMTSLYSRMVKL